MNDKEGLKEWIERELILSSEKDEIAQALSEVKEDAKQYIRLLKETKGIRLLASTRDLPNKWKIYLYLVGKTFGFVADMFETDQVTNKELEESLKLPEGTIRSELKDLRDEGWIIQIEPGIHRLNYSKLTEAFQLIRGTIKL